MMKKNIMFLILAVFAVFIFLYTNRLRDLRQKKVEEKGDHCFTGAFIADVPSIREIKQFKGNYGKKPYYVMIFVDWGNYPDLGAIRAIFKEGCFPMITWEPWYAGTKEAIDIDALLEGEYDEYIVEFATLVSSFSGPVMLRFAHEMNGNWYPWAGSKIGVDKYKEMYRYVKDKCDESGTRNVKWIFSVNCEDVPAIKGNEFLRYYPGDEYADLTGIDGYNWGNTQSWSSWKDFEDIFREPYGKMKKNINKPVLVTEFGSASSGGDKAQWISDALSCIKSWRDIKGFVLFNVDKEADWYFDPESEAGKVFKQKIGDPYFIGEK
jgi:beta-mannanase